ncbi:alpha/beta fold hydrolase [Oceanirhabdus sp. W0125-5]|uniref:alpha/beta fold hydrolase n=1 Tax=Oceanirhabdus sp. W0125-5 TaxID=2999116 RepID=UPI0022F3000E|nr:alpha/beta hydrolase [Oceanirhabdus sp. W0125-5]WBW97717.1 alpha/beta hydrolase [Oceanirhabdus sp. W0125-5]
MKYNVIGENNDKVLVFINGGGLGYWMWDKQKELSKTYKCILFDFPGHGENVDSEFTTLDDLVEEIKKIIEKESENKKAIWVGLSIGAQTVMNGIMKAPEYIEKAVIISGLNNEVKINKGLMNFSISMIFPLIKYRWWAKLQSKQFSLPDEYFNKYYEGSKIVSKKTLLNVMNENMSFEFKNLSNFKGETIILVGKKEIKSMHRSAKKIADSIENSKLIIFENSGHGIPYEEPERLNRLLNELI